MPKDISADYVFGWPEIGRFSPPFEWLFCPPPTVTKVMHVFDAHVSIPRKPLPEVLSMDEHYFPESDYDSLYCCLLMNFQNGEVIDILPDRRKQYLIQYFSSIKRDTLDYTTQKSELNRVKYISIDLYEPFRDIAGIYFPKALVCADSFHVLEHLTDCFRKVRLNCRNRTENETLQYLFSKFKFVFQHGLYLDNEPKYNRRLGRYLNYRGLRDIMFSFFPELQEAYELKEYYIHLNKTCSIQDAPESIVLAPGIFNHKNAGDFNQIPPELSGQFLPK